MKGKQKAGMPDHHGTIVLTVAALRKHPKDDLVPTLDSTDGETEAQGVRVMHSLSEM